MAKTLCLNENYSTTRLLCKIVNDECSMMNGGEGNSKLFLPMGENRKGEGGLRTQGYFKQSYEDQPLISIITVVFNGEKYLEETIQNVINQTYDNVEYIIIDGGSTDGTLDIIKKYEDRIDYWVSERDRGIYDAMNKGILFATGEWINFMNAGDFFWQKTTCKEVSAHIDPTFDILYGSIYVTSEEGSTIAHVKPKQFTKFNLLFWQTGTLCHQAVFIRKEKIVMYDITYQLRGEIDWYLQLVSRMRGFKIVDFPIAYYALGGVGERYYKISRIETINILVKNHPFLFFIGIPYIVYNDIRRYLNNFFKA